MGRYSKYGSNAQYEAQYASSDSPYPIPDGTANSGKWWKECLELRNDDSSPQQKRGERPTVRLWTAVSICTLFRSPFIRQISICLETAYWQTILPNVMEWERNRRSETSCDFEGSGNKRARTSVPVLLLNIEQLIATLSLESPKPVAGLMSLTIRLPIFVEEKPLPSRWNYCHCAALQSQSQSQSLGTASTESSQSSPNRSESQSSPNRSESQSSPNRSTNTLARKLVKFILAEVDDLPQCSYPVSLLLEYFEPRVLVDIVCCILSECRMLFHTVDLSKLPAICEALRTIIYPLKWTHGKKWTQRYSLNMQLKLTEIIPRQFTCQLCPCTCLI